MAVQYSAGTLGYLTCIGTGVYVVCERCGHFALVDLGGLLTRFGHSASVSAIAERMRCKLCGARESRLTTERPAIGERVCPRCQRPYHQDR